MELSQPLLAPLHLTPKGHCHKEECCHHGILISRFPGPLPGLISQSNGLSYWLLVLTGAFYQMQFGVFRNMGLVYRILSPTGFG